MVDRQVLGINTSRAYRNYHHVLSQHLSGSLLAAVVEADERSPATPLASEIAARLSTLPSGCEVADSPSNFGGETLAGAEKSARSQETHPVCAYFGVTDEQVHALVANGKRGKDHDIQYLKCQACQKVFTCRKRTPLYYLRTKPVVISDRGDNSK